MPGLHGMLRDFQEGLRPIKVAERYLNIGEHSNPDLVPILLPGKIKASIEEHIGCDVAERILSGNCTKLDLLQNFAQWGKKLLRAIRANHKAIDKLFQVSLH